MSTYPSVVTIMNLTTATTLATTAFFEATQTTAGRLESIKGSLSQISNAVASMLNIGSLLVASTGISIAGSTVATVAFATTTPLSVLGVAGTATTNPLPIVIATGAVVLRANDGGTGIGWGAINLASTAAATGVLPLSRGGWSTATLTAFGVVFGNGSSTPGITAAGATGWSLLGNGTSVAPSFQQVNLTQSVTGVLTVPFGGTGTSTLTAFGVLLGAGTSTVGITAAPTAGQILVGQNATTNPSFTTVSGDLVIASTGVSTVTTAAITFAKMQTASPLSVLGNASTATAVMAPIIGAANQLLSVNAAATTVLFQSASNYIDIALSSTQGAILYRNAASWVSLAPGTNGQVLQTQGAAANPRWIGGLVLLNTLSPNGVASTNDTTSLTSAYANYLVLFENVCPATQTTTFQMQVSTSGSNFISGTYVSVAQVNVSSVIVTDTSTTAMLLSGIRATTQLQTTTTYGLSGFMRFGNPAGLTARKTFVGETAFLTPGASGTTTFALAAISGYYDANSNAVTGLNFLFNSGNIATGTIKIYGLL